MCSKDVERGDLEILMVLEDDDCGSMMEINDIISASGAREQAEAEY